MTAEAPAVATDVRLADLTTLRLGGPAARMVTATTEDELVEAVRGADAAGEPVLVLGGGSNLVVGDDGFDGLVVRVATRGVGLTEESFCSGVDVTVAAGEDWDELVALTVDRGWSGLEALSGIPGLTGATPIQNVGAYGADVSQTISTVRTWDRHANRIRTFFSFDCGFGYRTSVFKAEPGRYVVLDVTFQLPLGDYSAPVRYAELARALDVELGTKVKATELRQAVLALRAGKGMVLDAADHDTWSTGSFFTNPLLTPEQAAALPQDAPRHPAGPGDDRVKTSAAWLVEHAGFPRGWGPAGEASPARLSTKHALAVTNRGAATAADVLATARAVRDGVRDRFGVELLPEPELVGCAL